MAGVFVPGLWCQWGSQPVGQWPVIPAEAVGRVVKFPHRTVAGTNGATRRRVVRSSERMRQARAYGLRESYGCVVRAGADGMPSGLRQSVVIRYSPGAMAPEGHTSAHVPQSTQVLGSIEYFSPSEIAPEGHSSMHVPQAMQSSLIT